MEATQLAAFPVRTEKAREHPQRIFWAVSMLAEEAEVMVTICNRPKVRAVLLTLRLAKARMATAAPVVAPTATVTVVATREEPAATALP